MHAKCSSMFLVLAVLSIPVNGFACSKTFSGVEFLKISHNKGAAPKSTCFETDLLANKFYAYPDRECEVTFSARGWLAKGWKFYKIDGLGRFSVKRHDGSITIVIKEKGGFSLESVTLSSDNDDCEKADLDDVL